MEPRDHPLANPQILAAFAATALFWGLGVTLIDQHTRIGIVLCALGVATTLWIYWTPLRAIRPANVWSWPWLGIALLVILVGVPIILFPYPKETPPTSEKNSTTILESEFARARTQALGSPIGQIETTTDVYQASHEHAMVVSLLPVQTVFAFPKDGRPATTYRFATISDERKWWDDGFLRDRFKPPKDKKPPEYRVAEAWDQKPEQIKWIGWREWSCPFRLENFYYQQFENGIVFGILPTSESLGSSQIITFLNGGKWSAIEPVDKIGGVSAPACNEKTARVNGVVIHGHHVKPLPSPQE
jgi:hypothetical protein